MSLTEQQVHQFYEHGVLIAPDLLTDDDLDPVIEEINHWVDDRARQLKAEGKIDDLHENEPFERRLAFLTAQCKEAHGGLDIMDWKGRAMFQLLFNGNLLDAVESLIGPEITCNPIQHLRAKLPIKITGGDRGNFGDVPWHQDVAVTWEEADESEIITVWFPLVDANEQNGCMRIIPDIVSRGYIEHQREGGTTIRPQLFPHDVEPIVAECPKRGIVFLSMYTPHQGLTNHSNDIRWSMDLRYQETGTPTGRPFWPQFIVRSAANPSSVQNDYDQWCQKWDEALEKSKGIAWHRTVPVDQRIPSKTS